MGSGGALGCKAVVVSSLLNYHQATGFHSGVLDHTLQLRPLYEVVYIVFYEIQKHKS